MASVQNYLCQNIPNSNTVETIDDTPYTVSHLYNTAN